MDNHCTEWYNFSHKRIYKTRSFARWARKVGVSNDALCKAVSEMSQGLIDADLGGYVVKKRVTLPGQGKRGGGRTIVATKLSDRWFFLYGFSKSERNNIDKDELKMLQEIARELLSFDGRQLAIALAAGEIQEVGYDHD
ncbi:type II toxin-antitoxin system RelE/ParE family toxin [Eoetvoesia caeni]|uniref:RelE toxin of RelEB toxin-antitoxin system n=1 Tax=Eoetvoesiella caeni TaxID=645616 RepID=A0A366H841_9BURK|nr:type II toxin-antitoxin system RelE/ParE family toxin [Eoetvoesiella caeni]NYT56190.1 type II toxin-antitoxin system RelE/ParE family toxin [Eoetvoesiella caeni]RBP38247.1 hypothetical protein DFR37_10711 [Eoetvoesiella caeni]